MDGKKTNEVGEMRKEILEIVANVVYKFGLQMELKKNGTPSTRKKVDFLKDSLEFKNNFFSLVLIVLTDFTDNDVDSVNHFEVKIKK